MKRVLEIGQMVAGPAAGLIFADLGFEVIKIERPSGGDISRRWPKTSQGAFPFYNRGKKSLSLDMSTEEGKRILLTLASESDIIFDNLSYGAMDRLGLSYATLSSVNPRLIYISIKGYGSGPYQERKSLDFPIEVHSGLAYMTGLKGRPMRVGTSIVDINAAMFGVIAALNAIIKRYETNKGEFIDVGLFETALFTMGQHIATYQVNNTELDPINEAGYAWSVYDFFPTLDGKKIFIGVTSDEQWVKFCRGLELGLCDKAEYSTNKKRYDRKSYLKELITSKTKKMELVQISELLESMNIAYSVLNRPWDMLDDVHASGKMVYEMYQGKKIRVPTIPSGTHMTKMRPPALGQHSDVILRSIGYSESQIQALKKKKIV